MVPLMAAGAVTGLAGSIYGAIQSGKRQRQMNRMIDGMEAKNKAMFNADYYGDYTQRADAQNIIREMRNAQNEQAKRDSNTAVVTGATPESVAAAKEGRSKAMASVMGQLGAQGQQFKDRAKDRYMQQDANIQNMRYQNLAAGAEGAGNMMSNGLRSIGSTDWVNVFGGNSGAGTSLQSVIGKTPVGKPVENIGLYA